MKKDSWLMRLYARCFPVVAGALLFGCIFVFYAMFPKKRSGNVMFDWRPVAREAFQAGAIVGAIAGVLIQIIRPKPPRN